MQHVDLTFASPEENLALDEALLERCDSGEDGDVLRFWEPAGFFVVVGYGNQVATEVNVEYCRAHGIPILRRCSGGGTVLQGPGCLNYSLILRIDRNPALQSIHGTNEYVLGCHATALTALLGKRVEKQGQTDLAIGNVKFSGNAQRRRRGALVFHGSFLLHMDLDRIERCLPLPSKQPDYRRSRPHHEFLLNLDVPAAKVKKTLMEAWQTTELFQQVPRAAVERLVLEKYGRPEWNLGR